MTIPELWLLCHSSGIVIFMDGQTKKKAFVGMSGGVDSSVSAALLQREGYDVTGVFIKAWHPEFLECTWRDDRRDAMAVCAQLGIPFETCDLEEEYKRDVVDYLIREYASGRTPNPDVMCNQYIKFGAFFRFARERGADVVATGHYARSVIDFDGTTRLFKGVDTQKDQSYFLWTLPQETISHVLFPVGGFVKSRVRELAAEFGLPVAKKKDSQGICFLGDVSIEDFLKRFVPVAPGDVLDVDGDIIGSHEGALIYTFGQRHGFDVRKKKPDDGPWYVVAKDMEANTITVSQEGKTDPRFATASVKLSDTNWIGGSFTDSEEKLMCRFRYRQTPVPCSVTTDRHHGAIVQFDTPQPAVTPGQSLVIYKGEECLGGGVIV